VVATRQPVTVRLTPAQALRMEKMSEALWPTEKLSAAEVTRRLALTQLLWAESERNMVDSARLRCDFVTLIRAAWSKY
jgi:hypothetical protein